MADNSNETKRTLAILNFMDDCDCTGRRYYLVEQGGDTPLQKIKAAAIAAAESNRSWEVYEGPFTWQDLACGCVDELIVEHGVERVTLRTPGKGIMISDIVDLEVESSGVLVENSREPEPERFEFEPYCRCGLAAVTLCWADSAEPRSQTLFFISDPEHKGKVEEFLKKAAAEYCSDNQGRRFDCMGMSWGTLFSVVPEQYLAQNGLMFVTKQDFEEIDPQVAWIESVTVVFSDKAVCAAELA